MLFALERGNLVILCPILLTIVLSRIGFARCVGIALLINLKPYFVLLMFYYVVRKNWKALATCTVLAGLFFAISGLALDNNFLVFLTNIFNFSQEEGVFSVREVMSLPSSISAFSYVLKNPDGAMFASHFLEAENMTYLISIVEIVKWSVLATSLATLMTKSKEMRDAEIFTLLIVATTNLGVWVGGYTLIFYIALIPVLINLRSSWLYLVLLVLMAMPLDLVPIVGDFIGNQYSHLSGSLVDVQWTFGLGSVVRPVANIILLLLLTSEFFKRKRKHINENYVQNDLISGECGIYGEKATNG
jgi:hypothetical protein